MGRAAVQDVSEEILVNVKVPPLALWPEVELDEEHWREGAGVGWLVLGVADALKSLDIKKVQQQWCFQRAGY